MVTNLESSSSGPSAHGSAVWTSFQRILKRFLSGNPFYLASAGLLLYGINAVTTDPRLVGAERSLLTFNFTALAVYELILVITALALARRSVWYDAGLLIGMSNLFVIVPFSLINRAVYLSPGLAFAMCLMAMLLAVLKIAAFKRFIRGLNFPLRLLAFGTGLLLINAAAPVFLRVLAERPAQVQLWSEILSCGILPALTGLAIWLPARASSTESPLGGRWIPLVFYWGWIVVTAFHVLGVAYSSGLAWSFSTLVPTAWALAWTVRLRIVDLLERPSPALNQSLAWLPILIPLLAADKWWLMEVLTGLNCCWLGYRLLRKERNRLALVRLLTAASILIAGLPMSWVHLGFAGLSRGEWIACSLMLSWFWLVFLSRDPRIALGVALAVSLAWAFCFDHFGPYIPQAALVFVLLHGLRWPDKNYPGANLLRNAVGLLWLLHSVAFQGASSMGAEVVVRLGASILLSAYVIRALYQRSWHPLATPSYALAVLLSQPAIDLAGRSKEVSPGFIAIAASFVLFGLGSVLAFTKGRGNQSH